MGKSVPWQDAMQKLTGSTDISAASIKRYFQPLTDWLKTENEKASREAGREAVGWGNEKIKWTKHKEHQSIDEIDIILKEIIKRRKLKDKN